MATTLPIRYSAAALVVALLAASGCAGALGQGAGVPGGGGGGGLGGSGDGGREGPPPGGSSAAREYQHAPPIEAFTLGGGRSYAVLSFSDWGSRRSLLPGCPVLPRGGGQVLPASAHAPGGELHRVSPLAYGLGGPTVGALARVLGGMPPPGLAERPTLGLRDAPVGNACGYRAFMYVGLASSIEPVSVSR